MGWGAMLTFGCNRGWWPASSAVRNCSDVTSPSRCVTGCGTDATAEAAAVLSSCACSADTDKNFLDMWLVSRFTSNWSHTNTHTHPFYGPLSGTTRVSRYQKGKTNLDFTKARDSEWQWHQLGCMQVCISLQTDNHASTPTTQVVPHQMLPKCRSWRCLVCTLAAILQRPGTTPWILLLITTHRYHYKRYHCKRVARVLTKKDASLLPSIE